MHWTLVKLSIDWCFQRRQKFCCSGPASHLISIFSCRSWSSRKLLDRVTLFIHLLLPLLPASDNQDSGITDSICFTLRLLWKSLPRQMQKQSCGHKTVLLHLSRWHLTSHKRCGVGGLMSLFTILCWLQLSSQHVLLEVGRGHVLQRGLHPLSPQPPLYHPLCGRVSGRPQPVRHRDPVRVWRLSVLSAARAEEVRSPRYIIPSVVGIAKIKMWFLC